MYQTVGRVLTISLLTWPGCSRSETASGLPGSDQRLEQGYVDPLPSLRRLYIQCLTSQTMSLSSCGMYNFTYTAAGLKCNVEHAVVQPARIHFAPNKPSTECLLASSVLDAAKIDWSGCLHGGIAAQRFKPQCTWVIHVAEGWGSRSRTFR